MKRFFRLSAALAALALLSGCASLLHPRLVEDLQLIQTIGFDGGIGDMTVSVSSGEASEDAVSAQLAARGASIQTAVQRLQDFSPRKTAYPASSASVAPSSASGTLLSGAVGAIAQASAAPLRLSREAISSTVKQCALPCRLVSASSEESAAVISLSPPFAAMRV